MAKASDHTLTLAQILAGIITDDGRGNLAVRSVIASENTPPSNILLSENKVKTGEDIGSRIGILTVSDKNIDDTHILSITDDPDDKFAIENPDTATGTSYLVLKNEVDKDIKEFHAVTIKATDPADLSISIMFTIQVLDAFTNTTSLVLDGVDEYGQITNSSNYHFSDGVNDKPFSLFSWTKMVDATNFRTLSKGSPSNRELLFGPLANDKLSLILWGDAAGANSIRVDSAAALTSVENTWIHIGCTYDGSSTKEGITLYLNGVLFASIPTSGGTYTTLFDSSNPMIVGGWIGSNFSNGYFDETVVINKELTEVEVAELYNGGEPYDLETHSRFSDFISWHRYEASKGDDATSIIGNIQDFANDNDMTPFNTEAADLIADVP